MIWSSWIWLRRYKFINCIFDTRWDQVSWIYSIYLLLSIHLVCNFQTVFCLLIKVLLRFIHLYSFIFYRLRTKIKFGWVIRRRSPYSLMVILLSSVSWTCSWLIFKWSFTVVERLLVLFRFLERLLLLWFHLTLYLRLLLKRRLIACKRMSRFEALLIVLR